MQDHAPQRYSNIMLVVEAGLVDVKLIPLNVSVDSRGPCAETYDYNKYCLYGIPHHFVQDFWSLSTDTGTIRGLHFQCPPRAQHKLVRVARGRVLDVVVDLRLGSPTFANHIEIELSADRPEQLLVPIGFAHGFCTLERNTEVVYKMSDSFCPESYKGLNWADPQLAIRWPVDPDRAIISSQDRSHPMLKEISSPFRYMTEIGGGNGGVNAQR
jgi:dTDP-4-dehydrorhamnose 3,5-epimerase